MSTSPLGKKDVNEKMEREKPKSQLELLWEKTAFSVSKKKFDDFCADYGKVIKAIIAIEMVIGAVFGKLVSNLFGGSMSAWLVCTMIVYALMAILTVKSIAIVYKGTVHDAEFNLDQSDNGVAGTSGKMSEEEQKETFFMGNYAEVKGNILGSALDDDEKLYSLIRDYKTKMNGNIIVFGTPGSGKSRCLVIPMLFQIARRGESAIVTDSKGALYKKTAEMFRARGYEVKVLNFIPDYMCHSDGINFLSTLKPKDRIGAFAFAQTIIQNTSDGKDSNDYFGKSELNLLTACILLAINNDGIMEATLGDIYNFLSTHTVESLEAVFLNLPDSHPAKGPFNIFNNSQQGVKGDILGGLAIRLQIFNDPLVRKITGTNNVSFIAPGRKKCIYYIIMSDQDKAMSFLIALTFNCLYGELVKYADSQGGDKETLPVKVNMILDEFYSCGIIPSFDQRLSNVRSRGIDTLIILQSLGQLQTMYPEKLYSSIIDCCSLQILLTANSEETAKHFSDRSGDMTVKSESLRMYENAGDALHLHSTVQKTISDTGRKVYTVDEIQRLPSDRLLVAPSTHRVIELKRIDLSAHPMCKEVRPANPSTHIPDWLKDTSRAEREMLGIDPNEKFVVEGNWNIELCTEEDFREPWNDIKEKMLKAKIKEEVDKRKNQDPEERERRAKARKTEQKIKEQIEALRSDVENANRDNLIADKSSAELQRTLDLFIMQLLQSRNDNGNTKSKESRQTQSPPPSSSNPAAGSRINTNHLRSMKF